LGTRIAGIPELVRDGLNGYTFPAGDDPSPYVNAIEALVKSPNRYEQLALSTYREFRSRLTWNASLDAISHVLSELAIDVSEEIR
jgi:glycosyltransferase involved in cell wall biosynthesis